METPGPESAKATNNDQNEYGADQVADLIKELEATNEKLRAEVAELAAAEESLIKEKLFTEAILDSLPGAFYLVSQQGKHLRWNKNFEKITGFSSEEIGQIVAPQNIADEHKPIVRETMEEVFERGWGTVEADLISKDGKRIPLFLTGRRVTLNDETCLVGMAIDISERKQVENELRDSRRELVEAQRLAKVGSWTWEIKTDVITWSDELYRRQEAGLAQTPPPFSEHKEFYTPESWELFTAAVEKTVRTGEPYELELEMIRPYGKRAWTIARAEVIRDANGKAVKLRGTSQDITDRKLAEDELRSSRRELVEAQRLAKVSSWTWDVETDIITWSDEVYRRPEVTPEYMVPQLRDHRAFYTPESWERLMTAVDSAVKDGTAYELELELTRPDGRREWVVTRSETICDAAGKVVKIRGTTQDITERKLAEEKLRLSEERFAKAFNASPEPITIFRHDDGKLLEVNDRWIEVYGFTREQATGPLPLEYKQMAEEDCIKLQNAVEEQHSIRGYEIDIKTKTGDVRHVSLSAEQIVINNELCDIFLHRDITEQKLAEESLRESQRRFSDTLANLDMIAVMTDASGRITFCNEYLLNLTGWEHEEVIGQNWFEMFIPELEMDAMSGLLDDIPTEGSVAPHVENEIKTRSGELRLVSWTNTTLRDLEGKFIGIAALGDDITEFRRAEDALRLSEYRSRRIIETAPEAIVVVDMATAKFVDFNPQALVLFRLTAEEILNVGPADVSPEYQQDGRRSMDAAMSFIQRALNGETPVFEWAHSNSKGETIPCEVRLLQLPDESRLLVRGTITDISERKLAEDQLNATNEQLRALTVGLRHAREEEGTRIAREIHDELGSAMTSLKWDIESLEKAVSESESHLQMPVLRDKVAVMMKLIDTTVNVVRRISSELRPIILDDLGLEAAIEWQAEQFQARTGIICKCGSSLEKVDLNEDQSTALFRIFQEALTNVLRHARATRIDVAMAKNDQEFNLTIKDNGRGITDEEKSQTRSLGLLGMRERAQLIGGEISIGGKEGRGTVINVCIPLHKADLG